MINKTLFKTLWDTALLAATQILFAFSLSTASTLSELNRPNHLWSGDIRLIKRESNASEQSRFGGMPTYELLKGFSTSLKQGLDLWSTVQTERWKWRPEGTSLRWTERLCESYTLAVSISAQNITDAAKDYHTLRCIPTRKKMTYASRYFWAKKPD